MKQRFPPTRSRLLLGVGIAIGVLLSVPTGVEAATAIPPRPPGFPIVDGVRILSQSAVSTLEALDRRLGVETNGAEIGVLTIATTAGEDPNAFATRAFNTWKLGSATLNNGVLIMVAKADRKVQLILGDGIDDDSQRAEAQRIVSEYILPQFRNGDFESGVLVGAKETARRILGVVDPLLSSTESDPVLPTSPDSVVEDATPALQPVTDAGDSSGSHTNPGWFVGGAAGVGATGAAGVAGVRMILRKRPRKCRTCGTTAVLLGEVADDASLDAGQRAEERVGSVDYDVWDCPACDGVEVLRYGKLFTKYKQCPSCGAKTKSSNDTTVSSATTSSTGLARIDESCANCSFKNSYTRVIPRISESSSSSSTSSHSSSSHSSGGGGHSSGGGGGGSW